MENLRTDLLTRVPSGFDLMKLQKKRSDHTNWRPLP
jgi:hypothetical protein